ncbi:ABC transporter substrate-binding protein [Elusimicrobiota bacterium]
MKNLLVKLIVAGLLLSCFIWFWPILPGVMADDAVLSAKEGISKLPFDEEIRMSLPDLPRHIDNLDWRSLDRWYVISQLFDEMVIFDRSQKLQSGVILKWQILNNRTTIKFWLRDNIKFSNGRKILASDIAYSLKRYLIFQPPKNLLKKVILGSELLHSADSKIDGIEVLNEKELQIHLKRPLENIWSFLALPMCGGIVAREGIDYKTLKMKAPVINSGPYTVEKISARHIRLKANKYFRNFSSDAPRSIGFYKHKNMDQALQWFESGKTNLYSILDPFQLERMDKLMASNRTLTYPLHRIGLVYLNPRHYHWQDINVRKAFAAAFDISTFAGVANNLLVWGKSFFPPGSPGYITTEIINATNLRSKLANLKKVELLMEEGLYTAPLEEAIRKRLSKYDLKVSFRHLPKRQMANLFAKKEFDAAITSVGLPMTDHEFGIYLYFVEEPQYLVDNNGAINAIFEKITVESDQAKRVSLLREISKEIDQAKYIIPIYHSGVKYLVRGNIEIDKTEVWRQDIDLSQLRIRR